MRWQQSIVNEFRDMQPGHKKHCGRLSSRYDFVRRRSVLEIGDNLLRFS